MAGFRRHKNKVRAPRSRVAPFRCRLVVMVKAPVAGRVKTRLARELGVATATRFARHATAALLARLSPHTRWQTSIAVTPDGAATWRLWPLRVARVAQGNGDLGVRMQRIMRSTAPGPVVIIGTDVPAIRSTHIAEAFRLLGRHDAVLGPAGDGGYWLVGLRRRPRLLTAFEAVRWSTPRALADTLANLNGYSIARLATLSDVDNVQDYTLQSACSGRRLRSPQS